MDVEVDHYAILGLPSGEEGAQVSEIEISKAYRAKALKLHPDKRPDDPNAVENFQRLKSSYEVLSDVNARKLFDDLLRVKREQQLRRSQHDSKRRRMVSDLEERERAAFTPDPAVEARREEERIARKLQEEIARIRRMHANKGAGADANRTDESSGKEGTTGFRVGLDKEKVLRVTWEKIGVDYNPSRLREIFSEFGNVEDVVIKNSKKKGSAVVVMGSRDEAIAATRMVCGDISNPLLVVLLQPALSTDLPTFQKPAENGHLDGLVGAGYQQHEDSVLEKLKRKAAENKKMRQ